MKKLMVVAAMMVAASASFGATYNWKNTTGSAVYKGYSEATKSSKLTSGTAYLFAASSSDFAEGYSAYTQQMLLNALNDTSGTVAQNWAAITSGKGNKSITSTTLSTAGAYNTVSGFAYNGVVADGTHKLYAYSAILVTDGNNSYVYISSEGNTLARDTPAMDLKLGNQSTNSKTLVSGKNYIGSGWYAVGAAIPEPTSGLLLLIGFAGLALRRRRA